MRDANAMANSCMHTLWQMRNILDKLLNIFLYKFSIRTMSLKHTHKWTLEKDTILFASRTNHSAPSGPPHWIMNYDKTVRIVHTSTRSLQCLQLDPHLGNRVYTRATVQALKWINRWKSCDAIWKEIRPRTLHTKKTYNVLALVHSMRRIV